MSGTSLTLSALCALGLTAALLAADKAPQASSPLNVTVKDINGKEVNLAEKYKGKVVLAVNVASKCGYTKQYTGLEKLHEQYADKGLAILGFPCNQFGGQEPGSEAEIKEFCSAKYNVKFDLFSKIDVNGANEAPLYKNLKAAAPADDKPADIKWNFEKFLIGRDGKIVKRYRSHATPEEIAKDIEAELARSAKA